MLIASEGIDVSDAQHPASIDWARVRAEGISWAYIKILEGTTTLDKCYAEHVRRCRASSDILLTGYCYHHPSGTVRESALKYCELVDGLLFELPPVLDFETLCGARPQKGKSSPDAGCDAHPKASPQAAVDSCALWLETVTAELRRPLLYWGSGLAGLLRRGGADLSALAAYDQILADYTGPLDLIPEMPEPVAHQWSNGVEPPVLTADLKLDRNRSRCTARDLAALGLAVEPRTVAPEITADRIALSDPTTRNP